MRFSPDSRLLASGSFDHSIRLWDVATGRLVRRLAGHDQAVVSVAFSPDGRLLASGGDDSTVRLWRVADGAQLAVLTGGTEHVYAVAFSPDGRWLASGGRARERLRTFWHQLTGQGAEGARRCGSGGSATARCRRRSRQATTSWRWLSPPTAACWPPPRRTARNAIWRLQPAAR